MTKPRQAHGHDRRDGQTAPADMADEGAAQPLLAHVAALNIISIWDQRPKAGAVSSAAVL